MKKSDIYNQAKASMLYENSMKKLREKHRPQLDKLFQHLVETKMHRQGPGYAQYIDLMAKQIEENAEAYTDALLNSVHLDRRIHEEAEKILVDEMLHNLNHVETRNGGFRRKLISEGWEQDKSFCQSMLSQLPQKSLSTRQFLTNKIRLKVIAINEEYDPKHKIDHEKDASSTSKGSDKSDKIFEKLEKHPIIVVMTVLGSLASIIALIFVFKTEGANSPVVLEKETATTMQEIENYYNIEGNATFLGNSEVAGYIKEDIKRVDSLKEEKLIFKFEGKEVFPEEGKYYTIERKGKSKLSYMYKDGLVHVEYTTSDGITGYYIIDDDGNVVDEKFPYPLQEYTIQISKDMELHRETQTLSNGFRKIHVVLKWDNSADFILDSEGKLQQLSIRGGARVSHRTKTISPRRVEDD